MKKCLVRIIKKYQQVPGNFHNHCKYYPTCSSYAIEAIENYGVFKGMILSLKRILRCNPLSKGGYDPVPIRRNK